MGATDTESVVVITMGVVGLGKMGLSHLSIFRAHPDVDLVAVCDSTGYVLDVLSKYTGLRTYKDLSAMLAAEQLDAVVIATPSHLHAPMVRTALEAGVHVFCEKPFTLDDADGQALTALARERGPHHRRVQAGGGGDDHRVELLGRQHRAEVLVGPQSGVLAQHVEDVSGRVAHGDQVDLRVRAEDGQVGEAHLAEPDDPHGDHDD